MKLFHTQITAKDAKSPNLYEAIEYGKRSRVMDVSHEGYVKYHLWRTSASELGRFGVGIELYFRFVKYMAVVLLVMSLIAIPNIFINSAGNRMSLADQKFGMEQTTLGNQGTVDNSTTTTYIDFQVVGNTYHVEQRNMVTIIVFTDLGYCVMFLISLLWFKSRQGEVAELNDLANVTAADYSIEVTGFPTEPVTEEEVRHHFQKYGKIVEVSLARQFNNVIQHYKTKAKLGAKLSSALAKWTATGKGEQAAQKLMNRLNDIDHQIARVNPKNLKIEQLNADRAFIVFNKEEDRNSVLHKYRWSYWSLFRRCQRRHLRWRQQNPLTVKVAPEPSNILWENLEFSDSARLKRRLLTAGVTLLLLCFSFVAIYAVDIAQTKLDTTSDCSQSYTREEAAVGDATALACYCSSIGLSRIFFSASDSSFCSDYISTLLVTAMLTVISAVGVVVINAILKYILRKLASYERHASKTSQIRQVTLKVFFAQFLNTALIVLLVNSNLRGKVSVPSDLLVGVHDDMDVQWYATVGSSILVTMFVNVFSPHCMQLALIPFNKCMLKRKVKQQYTQRDLNALFAGPEFDIATRYAQIMNTIFVTMLYCSGLPILLPFAAASLTLVYWADKILFLRVCQRPPAYDEAASSLVLSVLPFAIVFHLAFAIWMYGVGSLVQSDFVSQSIYDFVKTHTGQDLNTIASQDNLGVVVRILRWSGFPLFCALCVLVVGLVFFDTILQILHKMLLCCNASKIVPEAEGIGEYLHELENIKANGLHTYDIRQNESYRDSIRAFDIS
eukprot:GILK01005396.1.p1 GENE.GILK01005396.1~~GILK01005396.1.p1  ORF type:complete len:784 (+),score=111.46 GILK01005396.1:81-2432(+)